MRKRAFTACESQYIHYTLTCITHACWVICKKCFSQWFGGCTFRHHQQERSRVIKVEGQICWPMTTIKTQRGGPFTFSDCSTCLLVQGLKLLKFTLLCILNLSCPLLFLANAEARNPCFVLQIFTSFRLCDQILAISHVT